MEAEGETGRQAGQPATVWGEFLRSHLRQEDATRPRHRHPAADDPEQLAPPRKLAARSHLCSPEAPAPSQGQAG